MSPDEDYNGLSIAWLRRKGGHLLRWWTIARGLGILCMMLGLATLVRGPVPYPPIPGLARVHDSVSSELLAIGITVLVIDNANERLAMKQEKERLILQLGSPSKEFAIEALRQLRWRRYHADGSLRNMRLIGANLAGADLTEATLAM